MIELLVVVAIIGILASISVPIFNGQRRKAARAEASANLESLRLLQEQFFAENGRYAPSAVADGTPLLYTGGSTSIQTTLRGFRPGNAVDLRFDYALVACAEGATPTCDNAASTAVCGGAAGVVPGQTFIVCAFGKAGSMVAGETHWINQNNQRNF